MRNVSGNGNNEADTPFVLQVIQKHYKATPPSKTPEQISREAWLVPGLILFNRWMTMPAAFLIQFCVGTLASWSVFNKPIDTAIYGSPVNMAPMTFYITIGVVGVSAAVMAPSVERHGPKLACILGGSLFSTGYIITSVALCAERMWLVYLGYGVVTAFGTGLCYVSPISSLQKWFPDYRGLASGVSVCGFGAGASVSAKLNLVLMEHLALPSVFLVLGFTYFTMIIIAGLVLRMPPLNYNPVKRSVLPLTNDNTVENANTSKLEANLLEAMCSTDFRLIYFVFYSNCIFGVMINSRLSNIITDVFLQSPEHASTVVSVNGAFNLIGRLLFPLLSDAIGRKNVYILMLSFQLSVLVSFYFTTSTPEAHWIFVGTIWLVASCFGGGFGTLPAFLTDKFGIVNVGPCHGVVLTAWSVAAITGGIVYSVVFQAVSHGRETNDPFPYIVNMWWILGIVVLGLTSALFVGGMERDMTVYERLRHPCGDKRNKGDIETFSEPKTN